MKEDRFFNFPISLIRPALSDINKVCNDAIHYAVYTHAGRLLGGESERIELAAKYLGVNILDPESLIEHAEYLIQGLPYKSPMTGISTDLIYDYRDDYKTEYQIVLLLANLALKSIIGPNPYYKVTNDFWFCRMAGYNSLKDMPKLPPELAKFKTRWYTSLLKDDLEKSFGMEFYGRYIRGFYCTHELSFEELVKEVEIKRRDHQKKYNLKIRSQKKSVKVKKILNDLNGKK